MLRELPLFLSHNALFSGVTPAIVQQLTFGASVLHLAPGDALFRQDETASAFYLIRSGAVLLHRQDRAGEEKAFQLVRDGGMIAETAVFARPCVYPLSARASISTVLYRMARDALLDVARRSSEVSLRLLEAMSSGIQQAINRIDLLTVGSARQRLVLYLVELSRCQHSRLIRFPMPSGLLARQLNIAPETLSRQLALFRQCALIEGCNRDWRLLDIEGMCEMVGLQWVESPALEECPGRCRLAIC